MMPLQLLSSSWRQWNKMLKNGENVQSGSERKHTVKTFLYYTSADWSQESCSTANIQISYLYHQQHRFHQDRERVRYSCKINFHFCSKIIRLLGTGFHNLPKSSLVTAPSWVTLTWSYCQLISVPLPWRRVSLRILKVFLTASVRV